MKNNLFDINLFNAELNNQLRNNSMNFGKCILPGVGKKMSIVATYSPVNKFATLNHNLETIISSDIDNYYYGVSPKFCAKEIIKLVSQLTCSTEEGFINCLKDNANLFSLHVDHKDYLLSFAKSSILTALNIYGVRIYNSTNDGFLSFCIGNVKNISINEKENTVIINGTIVEEELNLIDSKYKFIKDGKKIYPISIDKTNDINSLSIRDIFKDASNIVTSNDKVFYSGVLLKVKQLEINGSANLNVQPLNIYFERTTFLTVKVFTEPVLNHKYLRNEDFSIRDLLRLDDKVANVLKEDISNKTDLKGYCDSINNYLKNTCSVNQIGVSGNLITKDKYLLLGMRAKGSCDAEEYYPGVNGNAEVKDNNVDFYSDSVYEDYPDIDIHEDRIDFSGELNRETFAELSIRSDSMLWECKGLAFIGNINSGENYDCAKERRMHFNVICEQSINLNLIDVLNSYKDSSESYENQKIVGLYYKCYDNLVSMLINAIKKVLRFLVDIKDLILFFVSIFLLIISAVRGDSGNYGVEFGFSILFSVAVSLISIEKAYQSIKEMIIKHKYSYKKRCVISKRNKNEKRLNINKKVFKKFFGDNENKKKFHPTTLIALKLYLDEQYYNETIIK